MKKRVFTNFAIIVLINLIAGKAFAEEQKKIPASSIGVDVVLIGQSGLPLGTEFFVECMITLEKAKHAKDSDTKYMIIRKINGELLKEPKKIILWDEAEAKNGVWRKLIVVEDARYVLFFTPNNSQDGALLEKGKQTIYTGMRIVRESEKETKTE